MELHHVTKREFSAMTPEPSPHRKRKKAYSVTMSHMALHPGNTMSLLRAALQGKLLQNVFLLWHFLNFILRSPAILLYREGHLRWQGGLNTRVPRPPSGDCPVKGHALRLEGPLEERSLPNVLLPPALLPLEE